MIERTDVPTMYPEERVYQMDDGTLAVVVIRQGESSEPGRLVLVCDCWEVDVDGVPTGITAPRGTHSQTLASIAPGSGLGTLDDILDFKRDEMLARLAHQQLLATQLANAKVRWLPPPPEPAVSISHPLDPSTS